MIEVKQIRLSGFPDRPKASLRLVNGHRYGIFDAGDGSASVLLATLAGALLPLEGSVRSGGFDTAQEPAQVGRGVGYCAADTAYYGRMRVWELLSFVLELRGDTGNRGIRELHMILEQLGLENVKDRMLDSLNTEMRRRVGLAQALVGNPETLFFDQPTKGLRTQEAIALREDICAVAEDGKTLFLASNVPEELRQICDRFLFTDACGVSAVLEPEELEQLAPAEQTPAIAAFLGGYADAEQEGTHA